jgi:hypothetical protein
MFKQKNFYGCTFIYMYYVVSRQEKLGGKKIRQESCWNGALAIKFGQENTVYRKNNKQIREYICLRILQSSRSGILK